MCIADMVEIIVNDWTDADWGDVEAAAKRDFPQAMTWEIIALGSGATATTKVMIQIRAFAHR
jgi:hypothetical protein